MASVINRGNPMTSNMSSDCAPVCCPDCGGLECLCRPRFFCGQLLTDEDLNRLDHYITAKNRLHNRYLVGWGVVCGMNVVCNACDGIVTVKSGYALSACGDDIVVCADTPVDVCSMIQKCTRKQPRDCQPAQPGGPDPCSDTTEQWILSIHYDEKSSRGIVPLKNTGGSCSCGCGGQSSSSGCGCGGSANGNGKKSSGCGCGGASQTGSSSSGQAQCQPTIICETYTFQVCKVQNKLQPKAPPGALLQRFADCITALQGLVSAPPASNNQQDLQNWCCAIRDNLLDFFADNPGYTCSIPSQLAVLCQSGADPATVKLQIVYLLAQYIKDCFCSAFLPACPCPVEDASVPLATITVSKKSGVCRIVSICNLDVRKFATTLPNLSYWLSIFPFAQDLRKGLSTLCCKPLVRRQADFGNKTEQRNINDTTPTAVGTPFQQSADFSEVIAQAFLEPNRTVDVQTLASAILGLTDEQGKPFLSTIEMSHPMETLVANQFARPFADAVLSPGLGRVVAASGSTAPPAEAATAAAAKPDLQAEVAALKSQMDAMKVDLARSQQQIDHLNKRKNR